MQQANATTAADTIEFAPAIEGKTLFLSGGELTVSEDLHIDGEGVTLDAAFASRLLNITGGGPNVTIDNLTLAHGGIDGEGADYVHGGGVYVGYGSSLAMTGCAIRNCDVTATGESAAASMPPAAIG